MSPAAALAVAACATFTDLPLPARPGLAGSLAALHHVRVNVAAPLSVSEVALLAVQNDPDLRAGRAQHGVAEAQLLEAGLLPNPQLTGSVLSVVAGPGTTTAWTAGISEDIRSLITLSSRSDAARNAAAQVDAQLVWQEWQVVSQARLLAVDLIEGVRSLGLLQRSRDLFASRYERSRRAVAAGNETVTAATPDFAALQIIKTQINDMERQQLSRRHQLNALLGLAPDVAVPLRDAPDLPPWDPDAVNRVLATLAERRPDLIALQLGYRAQNAKLRTAILSQFPNLSFGVMGGSDNSNIRNFGPQVTLELPVFNRNQGNVAIERATRQQLHDEYTARLTAAVGQVQGMMAEIAQLSRQLETARHDLALATRTAAQAEAALRAGNLDERSYVDLVSARLTKEQEIVTMQQSLLEQRVAIATLVGSGMPPVILPAETSRS